MIPIQFEHAVALYSTILGLIVLFIWVYTGLTVRRYQRILGKQYLWRCVFCGYSYLDESAERLSKCPRCQNFNSADDKHARVVGQMPASEAGQEPQPGRRNPSHQKRPRQRHRGPRRR